MYNIPYLILGLIVTFVIPLGLLWIATTYSDKQNKDDEG
jgi:hypothetical protein